MTLPTDPTILIGGGTSPYYDVQRSLRFRASASAYLNRTFGTPTNNKIWTYSLWVKRGNLGTEQDLLNANSVNAQLYFDSTTNTLRLYDATSGAIYYTSQVFRDVSAWYHIIISMDTTQSTAGNRTKFYVNGSQVTSFSTATTATLNNASAFNVGSTIHIIGRYNPSAINYFDGYLAEVNFVDGQQLDASYFGYTDPTTGVWMPKKYNGSFGANGFYLPFIINSTSTYGASFNGSSQYLSATVGTSTIGSGDFTIEFWLNSTSATDARVFSLGNNNATGSLHIIYTGTYMRMNYETTTGATGTHQVSGGSWHHYALVRSGGTLKSYVDGVLDVNYGSVAANFNLTAAQIGANTALPSYFTGTLSNFRIGTTAVYTANFTPPTAPLTAITGTTLLTLQSATFIDNSVNAYTITNNGSMTSTTQYPFTDTVGYDASGNQNNWVPNNINVYSPGVTYDSMLDVPTNWADGGNGRGNYCVMNPVSVPYNRSSYGTLTNGNLTFSATSGSADYYAGGTIGVSSGRWYWEVTVTTVSSDTFIGINGPLGYLSDVTAAYWYYQNGQKYNNGTSTAYGASYTTGDVIGIALDLISNTITFYKNNVSQGVAFSGITGTFFPYAIGLSAAVYNFNFGQRPFLYTPPTGFVALNTLNIPASTILNGAKYMAAVTWTGTSTSSAATITTTSSNSGNNPLGIAFQPDFVWGKARSVAYNHQLYDSVRGTGKLLISNTTDAEATNFTYGYISAFNPNGFSTTPGATDNENWNQLNATYVAWQWNAGTGVTSSDTSGSVTGTVSVNQTAGFSIVTFTAPASGQFTVGHGLGVTPTFVIVKSRSQASTTWFVYSPVGLNNTTYMVLNTSAGSGTSSTMWGASGMTSTTIGLTVAGATYANATHVAYCWTPIKGFSSFGTFTGNASADGPFIWTGFRPKFVLIKSTAASTDWEIMDTTRDAYNAVSAYLAPDSSGIEGSSANMDILSNGFKIRTSSATWNGATTILYVAFAENPFTVSRAR